MQNIIDQISAKESFSDSDIQILMNNKHLVSQDILVRLGLAQAPAKEPVAKEEPKEVSKPIKVKKAKK